MSKPLYEEIQSFLVEKWGPLGGWCQAVMFAADLPPKTPQKRAQSAEITPKKRSKKI
jgi:N-glycosylase/DNA lyase